MRRTSRATALRGAALLAGAAVLLCGGSYWYDSARNRIDDGWSASESYEFPAELVRRLRESARRAQPPVQGREPDSASSRASSRTKKSARDPGKLVDAFPALHLRSGFVLKAYEYWFGYDARGRVFALPEGAPFPEPAPDAGAELTPAGALEDPMVAIEGDGSPLSYLEASILRRELSEFTAVWHGVDWGAHEVIDDGNRADSCTAESRIPWAEGWAPRVETSSRRVRVIFKTYTCLGSCRILRAVDEYVAGSYVATSEYQTLFTCAGGYLP